MRLDKLRVTGFKNLQDFAVDFDETSLTTVLVGRNGTGKSNLLEALVAIFKSLFLDQTTQFTYDLTYQCRQDVIRAIAAAGDKPSLTVNGQSVTRKDAFDAAHLPSNVFAYYSGPSNRLASYFDDHQRLFYRQLLRGEDTALRPMFYARLVHSQFVLLSYFAFPDTSASEFLRDYLGITGLESVIFVLKKPDWARPGAGALQPNSKFWGARGTVAVLLNRLLDAANPPITTTETFRHGDNPREDKEERIYLQLPSPDALRLVAASFGDAAEFFKALESMYISDLIREVRVTVRVSPRDDLITFGELSEGEQQLLTVLGLLRFTRDKESLFLLDEPDTHLNPEWSYDYLRLIERVVGSDPSSHVLIATHDPLVIGSLTRDQVQVFELRPDRTSMARQPSDDPRGLGVAGLLTSDVFGLRTTLDRPTQELLDARNMLAARDDLTDDERRRLTDLSDQLSDLGFAMTIRDPLYERFAAAMTRRLRVDRVSMSADEAQEESDLADEIVAALLDDDE